MHLWNKLRGRWSTDEVGLALADAVFREATAAAHEIRRSIHHDERSADAERTFRVALFEFVFFLAHVTRRVIRQRLMTSLATEADETLRIGLALELDIMLQALPPAEIKDCQTRMLQGLRDFESRFEAFPLHPTAPNDFTQTLPYVFAKHLTRALNGGGNAFQIAEISIATIGALRALNLEQMVGKARLSRQAAGLAGPPVGSR